MCAGSVENRRAHDLDRECANHLDQRNAEYSENGLRTKDRSGPVKIFSDQYLCGKHSVETGQDQKRQEDDYPWNDETGGFVHFRSKRFKRKLRSPRSYVNIRSGNQEISTLEISIVKITI
jgi:hypothetical protein